MKTVLEPSYTASDRQELSSASLAKVIPYKDERPVGDCLWLILCNATGVWRMSRASVRAPLYSYQYVCEQGSSTQPFPQRTYSFPASSRLLDPDSKRSAAVFQVTQVFELPWLLQSHSANRFYRAIKPVLFVFDMAPGDSEILSNVSFRSTWHWGKLLDVTVFKRRAELSGGYERLCDCWCDKISW